MPRFLQLTIDSIQSDLLLTELKGHAGLSESYCFDLCIKSRDHNIDADQALGEIAHLTMGADSQTPHYFHGVITEWGQSNASKTSLNTYQCRIESRLALLTLDQDYRGFVNRTPIQIIQTLLTDKGFQRCDFSRLKNQYPILDYCVQYNESSFNFIARLLEQHGIYYHFVFNRETDSLHFIDQGQNTHSPSVIFDYQKQGDRDNRLSNWQYDWNPVNQNISCRDFNPAFSDKPISGQSPQRDTNNHQFHYPGGGKNRQSLDQLSQIKQLSIHCRTETFTAETNQIGLYPGSCFALAHHPQTGFNRQYYISHIDYFACDNGGLDAHAGLKPTTFNAKLTGHPLKNRFYPKQITPPPHPAHAQTAIVCGPKDSTLHSQGKAELQIQFHWDRYSQGDLNRLPWVRSKQLQAADQWGSVFLPRVGQEVLVMFEDNDAARPMIIGALTNADHLPRFNPALHPHLSCISTMNEHKGHLLAFDDSPTKKAIQIQSSGSIHSRVTGHYQKAIDQDSSLTVKNGDYCISVDKGHYTLTAGKQISLICGSSQLCLTAEEIIIQADDIYIDQHQPAMNTLNLHLPPSNYLDECMKRGVHPKDILRHHYANLDHFQTIESIDVIPRWRKVIPSHDFDDFATLLRLPQNLNHQVISHIIQQYQPKTLQAEKALKDNIPHNFSPLLKNINDEKLIATIKDSLTLNHAPALRVGWLYVFAQCERGPSHHAFKQPHLFKEYQVLCAGDENVFYEVNLSRYAGSDERLAETASRTIELPYQYTSDGQSNGLFKVQVMFSGMQLSWPRIHRLGGMSMQDPRIQSLQSMVAELKKNNAHLNQEPETSQLNLIKTLQSFSSEDTLRQHRCGDTLLQTDLDQIYHVQYHEKQRQPITLENTYQPKAWLENSLFYDTSTQDFPTLLLDDPLGMTLLANQQILWLQQALLAIVNQIKINPKMKTALLTYQFFFNFRSDNIPVTLCEGQPDKPQKHFSHKKKLFDAINAAQQDLDIDKLRLELQYTPRKVIKHLLAQTQETLISTLESQPDAPWKNNVDDVITDYFAQGGHRYRSAHLAYLGFWQLACIDANAIDAELNLDPLPNNELEAFMAANTPDQRAHQVHATSTENLEQNERQRFISGYMERIYQRHHFSVIEIKKFYHGNQLKHFKRLQCIYQHLKKPAGFKYLDALFKQKSTLSQRIMPNLNAHPKLSVTADNKHYLLGDGRYNAAALKSAQQQLHRNLQENLNYPETLSKNSLRNLTLFSEMTLDKFQTQFHPFIDGLTHQLSKILEEKSLEDAIHYKKIILAMICDHNGLPRNAIHVGYQNHTTALHEAVEDIGQRRYAQHLSHQTTQAEQLNPAVFQVNQHAPDSMNTHDDVYATTSYQDALAHINKQEDDAMHYRLKLKPKLDPHFKKFGVFIKKGLLGSKLPISGALTFLAWESIERSYYAIEQQPDFFTISYFGIQLLSIFTAMKEFGDQLANLTDTQLPTFLFKKNRLVTFFNQGRFFGDTANIFEAISIVSSCYTIVNDSIAWAKSIGENEPAVVASDFMGIISSAALLTGGIKGIVKQYKYKQKQSAPAFEDDTAEEILNDAKCTPQAESLIEKKSLVNPLTKILTKTCDGIGDLLPAVDVIFWTATSAQIVSFILSLYEDNDYQTWAKKSPYASVHREDIAFKDNQVVYTALLDLIARPKLTLTPETTHPSSLEVTLFSQLANPKQIALKSYLTTQSPIENIDSLHRGKPYFPLETIQTHNIPIYNTASLTCIGMRTRIHLAQLPIARLIAYTAYKEAGAYQPLNHCRVNNNERINKAKLMASQLITSENFVIYATGQIKMEANHQSICLPNQFNIKQKKNASLLENYFQQRSVIAASYPINHIDTCHCFNMSDAQDMIQYKTTELKIDILTIQFTSPKIKD